MYVIIYILVIMFYGYAARILSTNFKGSNHATYQKIVVYTGDLFTCMDFDTMVYEISVCKTSVVDEKC